MNGRRLATLLLTLALIGVSACSDDDRCPVCPQPGPLALTLHLDDSAVAEFGPQGHVFASTVGGDVLAWSAWEGTGTVELAGDDNEHVEVTYTMVGHDGRRLRTFRPVAPSGEHAVPGADYGDTSGHVTLLPQNAPAHSQYTASVNGGTSYSYTPLGERVRLSVVGRRTDVYLALGTAAGPEQACWVRDVAIGEERVVDLAGPGVLQPVQARTLTAPGLQPGDVLSWRVAVLYPEGAWPEIITLDHDGVAEAPWEVPGALPAGTWADPDLYTQIIAHVGDGDAFGYVLRGSWPASLPEVDERIALPEAAPHSLAWTWVDARHRADSRWLKATSEGPAEWTVEAWGEGESSVTLPRFPAAVTEAWPHLVREGFAASEMLLEHDCSAALTIRAGKAIPGH